MNFGTSYKGSKSAIAERLMRFIPDGVRFVDLFAGGCAITHAAMLSGKFKDFLANDLDGAGVRLFLDAVNGGKPEWKRWVSRDEFMRTRFADPFVQLCWSFGNNQRSYMYSREIEPLKRAYHLAYYGDYTAADALGIDLHGLPEGGYEVRYHAMRKRLREYWTKSGREVWSKDSHGKGMVKLSLASLSSLSSLQSLQSLVSLERLQSLQNLQRLESLQSLESLQRLETSFLSYDSVPLREGDIVYCDPPYANTNGYDKKSGKTKFDSAAFWDWVRHCPCPCFVSEYAAPPDFIAIAKIPKRSLVCAQLNKAATECLFVHEDALGRNSAAKQGEQMPFDFINNKTENQNG